MIVTPIRSTPRKLPFALFLICLMAACSPTRGCSESQFKLEADSRLPFWLKLPAGLGRRDVDVELWYWAPLFDVDNVTVYVTDRNGRKIVNLTGRSCWHPATHWPMGGPVAPEPHYVILIVGSVVDVAEHSRGDWKMTDNADILATAKDSVARRECRHEPDNY
jgi:hypothetical protein